MLLRDAVNDPAFLSRDRWIRRLGWNHIAITYRLGGVLTEVPDVCGGRIACVTIEDVGADDWELVDPADVCEGR